MYPRSFDYVRARHVSEAVGMLAEHGDRARVLAGGMSLIPMMKYRELSPDVVVDIGRLRELAGIVVDGPVLRIGATTRHHEAASWTFPAAVSLVPELAAGIGDAQVRSMGTVGGGLAAVEPTGDWGTALLAMRGEVVVVSAAEERSIASDDLFVATHRTTLRPDELLTQMLLPLPARRVGTAFRKFQLRAAAAPLLSCAGCVELDGAGRVATAGLACAGLAGYPVRLADAEDVLLGEPVGADLLTEAGEVARTSAGGGFRGSVVASLVRETIHRATERAERVMAGAA